MRDHRRFAAVLLVAFTTLSFEDRRERSTPSALDIRLSGRSTASPISPTVDRRVRRTAPKARPEAKPKGRRRVGGMESRTGIFLVFFSAAAERAPP